MSREACFRSPGAYSVLGFVLAWAFFTYGGPGLKPLSAGDTIKHKENWKAKQVLYTCARNRQPSYSFRADQQFWIPSYHQFEGYAEVTANLNTPEALNGACLSVLGGGWRSIASYRTAGLYSPNIIHGDSTGTPQFNFPFLLVTNWEVTGEIVR